MHNLVPHFIQDNFKSGKFQGQFPAVGLFLDISGFSTMTVALMAHGPHGAEVLATMMRAALDPLMRSVHAQGGFIATLAGDAFTALFPLASLDEGDGYQRALAAAWAVQETMAAKPEWQTPYGSFVLHAKLGLAVGEVSWGIVTSQDQHRAVSYFRGTAVDGCAQAEHQAQAGEIVMDAAFFSRVAQWVEAQPVGDYYRLTRVNATLPPPQPIRELPVDPKIMAHFYPEGLVSQAHSGEFRQVVNLFIKLPTVRTEAQLSVFMQTLFELQGRYGGLLNRLDFGDKGSNLLFFWGAPVAYENDIERALNFLLALQPLTSIPIHAGVSYQIAHAGFIGSSLLEEYTCYGEGVNLAARLMSAAPRGEIWVDGRIAQRVMDRFELYLEGEMAFKGFAEKQVVYALYDRKEDIEAIYPGELLGREQELDRLEAFVAPLWQGRYTGALVVWGDPGIGKSRLVHAFQTSPLFETHQAVWALCQTDTTLREPFNPFKYWLRHYFAQSDVVTEVRNKRSFNQKLDQLIEETSQIDSGLAGELDRTRSFLGALVDLHWPDSLYEQLDPQGRYENTLTALTVLLQAESQRGALIIFLEDAHWLDDDSRAFISRLERALTVDESRSYPIAILAAARREGHIPIFDQRVTVQELDLVGFSSQDLAQLAERILKSSPSPQLLSLLEERSQGNPFFAEQILRYLQEEGHLVLDADGCRPVGTGDQPLLPGDVRAVLISRLDRLGEEVRNVVQTASILGREFELGLLVRMSQPDERFFQKMAVALEASIWTELSELRYLFLHALLHDTAYQMLVRTHRRELHALAVEAIEGLYADGLNLHYGELAYHSEQAEMVEKARRYLQLAGDAARDAYQNNQAVDYYSRAFALTPESDLEGRYHLLLEREALYALLGDSQQRGQDLEALAGLAEALDEHTERPGRGARGAEVGERSARYAHTLGDYQGAAAQAEKAAELAGVAGVKDVEVRAHLTWAYAMLRQGKHEAAVLQAEKGLELARQTGDQHEQSRALNFLGLIAWEQSDTETARRYYEHSLEVARESGNLRIEAAALNNLGGLAGQLGNYSQAIDTYQQSLLITQKIGDQAQQGRVLGNLGWLTGLLGDYTRAGSYCEQNLRVARQAGERENEAVVLANLSSFSERQGDYAAAQTYAQQCLNVARQSGDPSSEAWGQTYAGHAAYGLSQWEAAAQAYQRALEIRRSLDQPDLATEPLAGLARLALASGDIANARAHVGAILSYLDGGGSLTGTDEPLRVYLTCYLVLLAAGDPAAARILETAYSLLQDRAVKISDLDMRRTFLENVPYHREILQAWDAR